jgi:hypothetical protein
MNSGQKFGVIIRTEEQLSNALKDIKNLIENHFSESNIPLIAVIQYEEDDLED